jgi:pimeloyl-ACP methyl ester carboxylesterase
MTSTTLQLSNAYGTLSYREAGQGEAGKRETLVLIHGVGMQSAAWSPQIEYFSQSMRVISVDMPGHGGSSPLPKGAQLPEYVQWLFAALTVLDTGPVNLAGHSMGALIAGGFAISFPQLTRRVAVLNGVHQRPVDARAAVEARSAQIDSAQLNNGEIDIEAPLTRWFGDSESDQTAREMVRAWLHEINLDGYATAYGAFARGDQTYASRWPEVECPMLALTGDGDPNSTPEMSSAMASSAQNGQVKVLEGHRHMVNLTAPEAVNKILSHWLAMPIPIKSDPEGKIE